MPLQVQGSPQANKAIIALSDIGGGLNLKSSRFAVPPNQAVILDNVILVEDGSIIGRRGTAQWNSSSLGTGEIQGAIRAYVGANNHFLVAHGTTIWKGDDSSKTFTSTLTGLTTDSLSWFVQYLTFVYFANRAGDQSKKWDGTTWTNMGIAAPVAGPTVAAGAAGTPNGAYTVKVTFGTATLESNGSPASGSVSVVSQQISVTSIPLGPTGTTKRFIYGFKSGVSSVYQKIGEIADNVTTTFTITTDQSSWTSSIPTQSDPPTNAAWITVLFKNRLWKAGDIANPTRLYFSQIFVPEAWPSTYFVDIPLDFGDQITALFVLGDLLLVFSDNQIFYVIGDTPFSFVIKRSFAQAGCPGPWAVDRVENTAVFCSRFAAYSFDGYSARIISDAIEPQFSGILDTLQPLNYSTANKTTLRFYDRLKALVMSFPTGASTTNSSTYWLFLRRQGWVHDTRSTRLMIVTSGRGDRGEIYAFDVNAGIMRQWDVNYTDDGTNIQMRYKTGALTGDNPLNIKDFRWITIRGAPTGATINITAIVDYGQETDTVNIPLSSGSKYGTGVYGTAKYAVSYDEFDESLAANMKGREIELDMVVSYSDRVQMSQILITYTPHPGIRRRLSA